MVRALHPTTIELTTEEHLTARGDCIVGVRSEKGCLQLSQNVKERLASGEALVLFRLTVGDMTFRWTARGDLALTLTHPRDMVVRKSKFISDRTLAVGSSAAAKDIPRKMVAALRFPEATGTLEIEVM